MKIKKNYKVTLGILVIILLGLATYMYREYNRTNTLSEDVSADYKLNATDLIKEFENDLNKTSQKYVGKIIEVDGSMLDIEDDHSGNFILILGNDSILSKIRCSMDSTVNIEQLKSHTKNQKITVKGICSGYNPDDMGLGADVLLNKCLITSK